MTLSSFYEILLRNLDQLFQPFLQGLNDPAAENGIFSAIGWNLSGLVGADLIPIQEKYQAIQDTMGRFTKPEPLRQNDIRELHRQLKSDFESLCRETLTTSFHNVADEHVAAFVQDSGQFLTLQYLAKEYTLLYQVGELLGVIEFQDREAIEVSQGDQLMVLRYPGTAYGFSGDAFQALPSGFLAIFLGGLNLEPEADVSQVAEAIAGKTDRLLQDIKAGYADALTDGIRISFSAEGLTIRGNLFGFSQLSEPVQMQLPPEDKLTLQINGDEIRLLWGDLLDEISQSVPFISAGGLSLQLGGTDAFTAGGELTFFISEAQTYFELQGKTGFQLPAALIGTEDVTLASSGRFTFRYEAGGDYSFLLNELVISGDARLGGANGLRLSDCRISVQDIQYPLPPQGFSLQFQCSGALQWEAGGATNTLQVSGDYSNERLILSASADMHLGNGIWLHAVDGQPVLRAEIGASGVYAFDVQALFKIPHQNTGTKDLDVLGRLTLASTNGRLQLTEFAAASRIDNLNWELPGGIRLQSAGVALTYGNQAFSAALSGELDLEGGPSVQLSVGLLFPDINDPGNIRIDALIQASRLNFYDQLYLFDGALKLSVSTSPLAGNLSVTDATGGFLAKGALSAHPGLSDFHLTVERLTTIFAFDTTGFELQLPTGAFLLPEVFNYGGDERASIRIGDEPLLLRYKDRRLDFQASFVLENLGVDLSENGTPGFAALLETATLSLSSGEPVPKLSGAKGHVTIPIPERDPLQIAFDEVEWDLLGYPAGAVFLAEDIAFPLGGGFELKLIGGKDEGINTGLTIVKQGNTLPRFILDGAVDLVIPVDMLSGEAGDQIFIGSSGNLSWRPGEWPVPTLEELRTGGNFRLGGAKGIRIRDGELRVSGIPNMLRPTEGEPFQILLSGKIYLGDTGPGAGIREATFTFTGADLPLFDFQGFFVEPGKELLGVMEQLPLKVSDLEAVFVEPYPLPAKLAPTNIRVTLSAELEIPLPSGGKLIGMVDDISVHFNEFGIPIRKDGSPGIDIGGIGLGIDDFQAGSIVLTGLVYLGGLDNPEDLFFAGKVGGKFNGVTLSALLALSTKGPRGVCLEVSAGSAGIPLPYGFLITGAEGGVVFPNLDGRVSNADPCDIRTYITLNEDGKPERTDQPPTPRQEVPDEEQVIQQPSGGATTNPEFECPQGDCPPPAVSIISQPHPDRKKYPDRVIIKFTSIDEKRLNQLGITRAFFEQLGLTTPDEIAEATAGNLFDLIDENLPDLSDLPLPPDLKGEVENLSEKLKQDARNLLVREFSQGISLALHGNSSVYEAVRELAYAGIPSPETTLKLTGTFSHTAISSFLTITGGFSVSTVLIPQPVPLISTIGVLGSLNVVGIPVGTANLFFNLTDANGLPQAIPSICGQVYAGIGPVEFGQMRMTFEAEGLTEGLANAGLTFAKHLSGPLIHEVVQVVAAEVLSHPDFDPQQPASALSLLTFEQIVAFAGSLMNLPPERITPDIKACFLELINDAWGSFQPKFLLCGQVQPKLFGFSLGGEISSARINITKTSFAAQFGCSPSFLLGYFFGGIFPAIDKASVGMAFELPDPVALLDKLLTTDLGSVSQLTAYLEDGFGHVLEKAIFTVEYELAPMGLKMADAEARLILPDLVHHPSYPGSTWKRPEDRSGNTYLSRLSLLEKTLDANVLANPLWKGSADDLDTLTGQATHGLSMTDYFPHGGFLGAARLSLPLVLLDGIPPHLIEELFEAGTDLLRRFNLAKQILEEYVLKTDDIGRVAFYVPFPNPPSFTIDGQHPTPRQIIQKMQEGGFDWSEIEPGELLAIEQAFFEGRIQRARILGVPVLEAHVTAYGPDAEANKPGRLEITAGIPAQTWLHQFVDNAALQFTLSQTPARPVDEYFRELLALLQYYQGTAGRPANLTAVEIFSDPDFTGRSQRLGVGEYRARDLAIGNDQLSSIRIPSNTGLQVILYEDDNFQGRNIIFTGSVAGLGNFNEIVSSIRVVQTTPLENLIALFTEGLPKMVLEARIDRLRIPAPLAQFIRIEAETSLLLKAYSPFFNPAATGADLDARLQRHGGICLAFRCYFGVPGIFEVNIPHAQFACIAGSDDSVLPQILGEFTADTIDLPLGLPKLTQSRIYFNSAAGKGENIVEVIGQLSYLPFGQMRLASVTGGNVAASLIVGRLTAEGQFDLALSAMKVDESGFVRSDLLLDGGAPGQPLTVRSHGDWSASARGRRVSLFAGQLEMVRVSSDTLFSASVSGTGFSRLQWRLSLPLNVQLTTFPGHPVLESRVGTGNKNQATLSMDSEGAFSLRASIDPLDFGLIRISGTNSEALDILLSSQGYELVSGAELHIANLTRSPYRLSQFVISPDATFTFDATGGTIGVTQFFELSGGKLGVSRTGAGATLSVEGHTLTLFPGTDFSNQVPAGNFSIDSNGYFEIDSSRQRMVLPGLIDATGRFRFGRNRTGISGNLDRARITLAPFGQIVSGDVSIINQGIQATVRAWSYGVKGWIELPPATWQLDWQRQDHFTLSAAVSSLQILNQALTPEGQFVFTCQKDGSLYLRGGTNSPLKILPDLLEIGTASIMFSKSKSSEYDLQMTAAIKALKNPATGQWILSQSADINFSDGNFKNEITALRSKTFVDVGLARVYSDGNSRTYLGRNDGNYFLEFNKLKFQVLGQENEVSGNCSSSGILSVAWDAARELALGPFRLSGRKAEVVMNLKTPSLTVKIPAGKLTAPGVTGFPAGGIDVPMINIGSNGDFEANLGAFVFNGIQLSTSGFDDSIRLYGKDRKMVIRNRVSLWGTSAALSLDIWPNGSVTGSVTGSFTLTNITVGLINFPSISLGSATLVYDGSRSGYQFQTTIQLNNVSGQEKRVTTKATTVWNFLKGLFDTVTQTVITWVARTFRIRVTLQFGSSGARAEVQIL